MVLCKNGTSDSDRQGQRQPLVRNVTGEPQPSIGGGYAQPSSLRNRRSLDGPWTCCVGSRRWDAACCSTA
ncbi:hypothetical protein MRX96_004836 [Rhipicephalus microplus]